MTNEELLKVIRNAKEKGATSLYLSGKQLTELPPEIGQLTNLTWLELQGNRLTSLPQEICRLTNLQELNLRGNRLINLPPELFQLTSLTELHLGGNQLTTLPPEIGHLRELQEIYLWGNKFTALPPEIGQLTKLKELQLYGNPLTSPPIEIARLGIEAIRLYFASLQPEDQPLNEVKVLLVGDGAAGKTSLVKQLLGEAFNKNEDTTHGISIRGWDVEAGGQPIKVNIWDFGGQEIMHATHQFFLSKRSLYVLVLDGRKDERAEYWMRYIESFGGDSPVLVVLNKQDSNPSFDLNRPFLLQKYPGIRQFFRTCCADGRGIDQFKAALIHELGKVPMIGIRWPQSWFAVKQRIEQMGRPYISREDYGDLCAEAGLVGEDNRSTLVDFLHDLGVAVHFKDYILNATHVLDPVWVTNAVYKLINAEQTADSKGRLRLDSLCAILPQGRKEPYSYPASTHAYVIELMKKFQLCWRVGEEAVLIPQLLPVPEPPFTFDYSGALGFVLHYHSFLPPSVMPRFLVKLHGQIKPDLCWRTGAVLRDKDSRSEAVIKADTEARRIYLWVNGLRRKEYLSFLWFSLREINSSFEKLAVSERIPMPDDKDVTADYQTLLDSVQDGIERIRPDGAKRAYNVKELLGLVELKPEENESFLAMMNSVLELKPNVIGLGLNLNELFARILGSKKRK
jgi:internalin A